MTKQKEVKYYKPYMGALSGKVGRNIIESILNTPKPDRTELKRRADECRESMLAEMTNNRLTSHAEE